MAYGLLTAGFVPKSIEIVRGEINQIFWDTYGSSLDLSDNSTLGRFIGIFAEQLALLWELAEAVNASQDPDTATGARLDALAALSGTIREAAASSTVDLLLTGAASTTVPAGSQASVTTSGEVFSTDADATLVLATAWQAATAYAVGDVVSNTDGGGIERIYLCTVAGTSAGSGGPLTTATAITDNTATWRYVGEGLSVATAAASSVNTGPIVAAAYDIATIETPVSGWENVLNALDADLGSDEETDEDLRIRREQEIADAGAATVDAVRAALLKVTDVTSVTCFWNHTDTTDADGVPPHAVEALIQGGTDQDIFDALLANVAGGIQTHGTTVGTAEDSEGNSYAMEFSRPSEQNVYVEVTLEYDADLYPVDGDTQVKEAIVTYGDAWATGRDVVSSAIKAACFNVAGVLDVSLAYIGLSASPSTETTVVITSRQLAVYDTSRITVTSSAGTP